MFHWDQLDQWDREHVPVSSSEQRCLRVKVTVGVIVINYDMFLQIRVSDLTAGWMITL